MALAEPTCFQFAQSTISPWNISISRDCHEMQGRKVLSFVSFMKAKQELSNWGLDTNDHLFRWPAECFECEPMDMLTDFRWSLVELFCPCFVDLISKLQAIPPSVGVVGMSKSSQLKKHKKKHLRCSCCLNFKLNFFQHVWTGAVHLCNRIHGTVTDWGRIWWNEVFRLEAGPQPHKMHKSIHLAIALLDLKWFE